MGKINICLEINMYSQGENSPQDFEKSYQNSFKHFISYLYSHPKLNMSFSFSGSQLVWMQSNHPEAIKILSELTSRHQLEVLGGGYWTPVFPLLFPVDRSGQIEKMTSTLRATVGKKPRGASLFGSIWDSSLITTFQSCGFEYVQLDDTVIPSNCGKFTPLIVSEQGKALKVLPVCKELLPLSSPEKDDKNIWFSNVLKITEKTLEDNDDAVFVLEFTPDDFSIFFESALFAEITRIAESEDEDAKFVFTTPQKFLKSCHSYHTSYVPAGMEWKIARYAQHPYEQSDNDSRFPLTIHDFLNVYTQNRHLYERMMFISMLIMNCHGDKMRKIAAREKLWQSQNGFFYVALKSGLPSLANERQKAFKILNEAEKLIREADEYKESISSYDYNSDGINEYVCSYDKFHAVISPLSGSVCDFNVFNSSGNYAANLSRIMKFDGVEDDFKRGIFVEHLIEEEDRKKYLDLKNTGNGVFSRVMFTEKKLDLKRKEIQLEGEGIFTGMQQNVRLRKNYTLSPNGLVVQYILKNESPFPLKGVFIVESNFAWTDMLVEKQNQYDVDLIVNGEKKSYENQKNCSFNGGVSFVQITDSLANTSFEFQPNEDAGFVMNRIDFKRPLDEKTLVESARTLRSALYWNIDIASDREVEKTIYLNIVKTKKRRTSKNSPSL